MRDTIDSDFKFVAWKKQNKQANEKRGWGIKTNPNNGPQNQQRNIIYLSCLRKVSGLQVSLYPFEQMAKHSSRFWSDFYHVRIIHCWTHNRLLQVCLKGYLNDKLRQCLLSCMNYIISRYKFIERIYTEIISRFKTWIFLLCMCVLMCDPSLDPSHDPILIVSQIIHDVLIPWIKYNVAEISVAVWNVVSCIHTKIPLCAWGCVTLE